MNQIYDFSKTLWVYLYFQNFFFQVLISGIQNCVKCNPDQTCSFFFTVSCNKSIEYHKVCSRLQLLNISERFRLLSSLCHLTGLEGCSVFFDTNVFHTHKISGCNHQGFQLLSGLHSLREKSSKPEGSTS